MQTFTFLVSIFAACMAVWIGTGPPLGSSIEARTGSGTINGLRSVMWALLALFWFAVSRVS